MLNDRSPDDARQMRKMMRSKNGGWGARRDVRPYFANNLGFASFCFKVFFEVQQETEEKKRRIKHASCSF